MNNSKSRKIRELGYIRAFSCIAIIFIHVIFSALILYGDKLELSKIIFYRSILNNLMWGVPCFLMVTGVLLLNPDKKIGYDKILKRYVLRILCAIVVFGVLFSLIDFSFSDEKRTLKMLLSNFYEIFTGQSWSHLWYLYCLVGIYLLMPFYKMIVSSAKKLDICYLLIIYIIFLSVIPFLNNCGISCGFYIPVSSIYPFWIFYGYYLKQWEIRRKTIFFIGLTGISTFALILLTWIRWNWNIERIDFLFGYSSFLVILQVTGVFGLIYHMNLKEGALLDKILQMIDQHSFGVYLIHLIFVRFVLKQCSFNPFEKGGIFSIILIVIVSFFLSLILDIVLKKIPLFRKFM